MWKCGISEDGLNRLRKLQAQDKPATMRDSFNNPKLRFFDIDSAKQAATKINDYFGSFRASYKPIGDDNKLWEVEVVGLDLFELINLAQDLGIDAPGHSDF